MARIDAPRLKHVDVTFTNQSEFDFLNPQLVQFINRSSNSKALDEAHLFIDDGAVKAILLSQVQTTGYDLGLLTIEVLFRESDF